MKKNILVIGGTGFIGSEIISQLIKIDEYNTYSFGHKKNDSCTSFIGDVEKIETLEKVYKEIHFDVTLVLYGLKSIGGSIDISKYSTNEIGGMINILSCCDRYGCKKVIYTSSSALYTSGQNIDENSDLECKSFYSFTKYTNENLLRWYKKIKNIDYEIVRCFNVAGITESNRVSNDIISLILQENKITILGSDFETSDGTLIRDYIHVKDVARAIVKCIELKNSNIFNIASGNGYSIKELIKIIEEHKKSRINVSLAPRRDIDQDCLIADIHKAKTVLDWSPSFSIDDIIDDTYNVISMAK